MEKQQGKLKLGYWAIAGKTLPIRLLLEYLKADYEEVRYEFSNTDKWFKEDKQKLGLDFPNLPYLIDGDIKLTESLNILTYVVNRYNKTDLLGVGKDKYKQNEIRFFCDDLLMKIYAASQKSNQDCQKDVDTMIIPKMTYLKNFMEKKQFLIHYLTIADFLAYSCVTLLKAYFPAIYLKFQDAFNPYCERFEQLDGIKEYIKSDKHIKHVPREKIKIGYWAGAGQGNPIRLLLEYVGLPYEEVRYTPQEANKWFGEDSQKLGLDFPNLPYLIDGNVKISESLNIITYVANKSGQLDLLGKGDEKFKQCEIRFFLYDFQKSLYNLSGIKNEEEIKKALADIECYQIPLLKKFLGAKDFLLGYLTIVDFLYYNLLCSMKCYLEDFYKKFADDFDPYMKRFESLPKIKEYMASDRYLQWKKM